MTKKYLLEIGTEELPYKFIASAINQLKESFSKVLEENPTIRLREELGAEPSVYYIPPKEGL